MDLLTVIKKIAPTLRVDSTIHAMWLEGSWATGKNNAHSDIDVWLDVDDGTFNDVIDKFRAALLEVGNIDWEKSRGMYSSNPKLVKHVFHLLDFPEEQTIELDLQEHSRNFIFNKNDNVVKTIFDKDNTVKW